MPSRVYLISSSLGLLFLAALPTQAAVREQGTALGWQTFKVPEYGTRIEYPSKIFVSVGQAETGIGQRFKSSDGRAALSVYALANKDNYTPSGYLRKHLRHRSLDYERVARRFFAISMERESTIYYSRCNFSGVNRGTIHCFDLVYPQNEKRAWDPLVTRISLSLRPLEQ
jgi:hypothetical protein